MLYQILKPIMKAALRLYYGRIVTQNLAVIDNGQPTIILANHTASFMDALVTACFIKRKICFFTRGDVFGNRFVSWILHSLGMLPVYRLREGREKLALNDHSNEEALKILAEGGAVLIFCEGASDIAKILKPLKKGPFRLAAKAMDLENRPVLIPLGINYEVPAKAFADVFIIAGNPIPSVPITEHTELERAKAATTMMRLTQQFLKPLVWDLADLERQFMFDFLLNTLKEVRPAYTFHESQLLTVSLNHIEQRQQDVLRCDMKEFQNWQRHYPVAASQFAPSLEWWEWLILLLGWPLAIIGYVGNFIPIKIANGITDNKVRERDFESAVFVSLATILTLIWYVFYTWLFFKTKLAPIPFHPILFLCGGWFYLKVFQPALFKFLGLYFRKSYRYKNSSYQLLEKVHQSLLEYVKKCIH